MKQATAGRIAFATFCASSPPICLFLLAAASETGMLPIRENLAGGAGMIVMLLLVAVAVAMFISCGGMTSPYAYLEAEVFETEYGVSGMVRERQRQYRSTYTRYNVLGACLCILSAIPLFGGAFLSENGLFLVGMLSVMLLLIGLGVIFFFIVGGVNWASMEKLLQEGDYTRTKKKNQLYHRRGEHRVLVRGSGRVPACSLPGHSWRESWVIWPVAGVLFAAVMAVCSALAGRKKVKRTHQKRGKRQIPLSLSFIASPFQAALRFQQMALVTFYLFVQPVQYGLHLADARSQLAALFHQQLFARGNGLVSLPEQAHIFNQRLHGSPALRIHLMKFTQLQSSSV